MVSERDSVSSRFEALHASLLPKVEDVRAELLALEKRYSSKAKEIGYLPLAGITTAGGLLGLLLVSRATDGKIDPSQLPDNVREAFELQYPRLHEAGELSQMTIEDAQPLMSGWVGKITEIMVRDRLNSGGAISGYRLADGEVAHLASSPTQEGWDIRVEPSGTLIQVKSTSDFDYVHDSAQDLQDDGIIFVSTNLDGNPSLDDLGMLLLEIDESKEEILGLAGEALEGAVDAGDDFDVLSDLLGPFALLFSAGTSALLVRTAFKEYQGHGSLSLIGKRYGPRVAGRAAAMISPVPFTGTIVRRFVDTRMRINDALRIAKMRIVRADRLCSALGLTQ